LRRVDIGLATPVRFAGFRICGKSYWCARRKPVEDRCVHIGVGRGGVCIGLR
jgi:hypothetical protein